MPPICCNTCGLAAESALPICASCAFCPRMFRPPRAGCFSWSFILAIMVDIALYCVASSVMSRYVRPDLANRSGPTTGQDQQQDQ
eukprot:5390537-Pyramimonas_sp.AAC.1